MTLSELHTNHNPSQKRSPSPTIHRSPEPPSVRQPGQLPNGSEPQHRSQRQRHRDALHHNNYLQQQQQQQQQQHQNQHSDGRQPHVTVGSGRSHAVVVGSDLPAIERIAASMAMLDIERTDAGFGDVGIPLSTRARVTRSSYRLDEIAEEATATLSPWHRTNKFAMNESAEVDGSQSPLGSSSVELHERGSSSTDSHVIAVGPPIEFNPPNADWQYSMEEVFNVSVQRIHQARYGPPRMFAPNAPPRRSRTVAGDGNCLFRALSFWICGSEEYHYEVRQTIVDELVRNARLYAAITEEQGIDATDYVSESRMANEGVWGSDVEIFVAATLLQTPIAVFSAYGDRQYLWQVFEPIQTDEEPQGAAAAAASTGSGFMIYLQNTNNHFEPVIDI